ncbi:MAG: ABC transporter permease subunit [Acidobacteriota bacterium]
MSERRTSRRQLTIGVLIGLAVGVGVIYWLGAAGRASTQQAAQQQTSLITLGSLVELVQLVDDDLGAVQPAVERFAAGRGDLAEVRVVDVDARRLVASTVAADLRGEDGEALELPLRLQRKNEDHKVWYDLGQELRAAVTANLDEGRAWKEEILVERDAEGGRRYAAPYTRDDEIAGVVLLTSSAEASAPAPRWALALGVVLGATLLFFLLSLAVGGSLSPRAHGALAVGVAALGLVAYLLLAVGDLDGERLGVESDVAAALDAEGSRFAEVVEALRDAEQAAVPDEPTADEPATDESAAAEPAAGAGEEPAAVAAEPVSALAAWDPAGVDPGRWDVDLFRVPRDVIAADGTIDGVRVDALFADTKNRFRVVFGLFVVLGLVLVAYIGLGYAHRTWRAARAHREAYAYVAPAMIGMLVLVFFPFFYGIALSFTNQTIYNLDEPLYKIWVGFDNYIEILTDVDLVLETEGERQVRYDNFYYTLLFTILWTVSNVTIGVSVGLFLALILNTKGLALRPIYRVLLILPWAVPNYITALIWKGMFHQQFGVINQLLQIVGLDPVAWFDKPTTSFLTVLTTNGWLSFPFMMVVSLGALQSIPADLYEAARVDGASRWQQFRLVTLPSLKPALVPAVILSVVWTFNMFNIIYLVSEGQPGGATEILVTQAYKLAFEQYQYGYSAAYATVIFGILLLYGTWQNRVTKAYEGV